MQRFRTSPSLIFLLGLALTTFGCQRQKQSETGKTYTSDAPSGQGAAEGNSASSAKQSDSQPLNAPADTTNGKSSKDSDNGSASATHGQVVADPGAPVERDPQPDPQKAPKGH